MGKLSNRRYKTTEKYTVKKGDNVYQVLSHKKGSKTVKNLIVDLKENFKPLTGETRPEDNDKIFAKPHSYISKDLIGACIIITTKDGTIIKDYGEIMNSLNSLPVGAKIQFKSKVIKTIKPK